MSESSQMISQAADRMESQLQKLVIWAFHVWSTPLQMLIRHNFGERYHTIPRLLGGAAIYSFAIWFAAQSDEGSPVLLALLFPVWFLAGCYHLWVIRQRNKAGQAWHSRSFGVSYLQGKLGKWDSDWTLYRFTEPIIFGVISFLISLVNGPLGGYFLFASLMLAFEANIVHGAFREQYLDRIDSIIEAESWSGRTKHAGKQTNFGFEAVGVADDLEDIIEKTRRDMAHRRSPAPRTQDAPAATFEDVGTAVRASMGKADSEPEFTPAQKPAGTTTPPPADA